MEAQYLYIDYIRLCGHGTPPSSEWPLFALRAKHRVLWNSTFCGWPLLQIGPAAAKKGAKESRGGERQKGKHVREQIQINSNICQYHMVLAFPEAPSAISLSLVGGSLVEVLLELT